MKRAIVKPQAAKEDTTVNIVEEIKKLAAKAAACEPGYGELIDWEIYDKQQELYVELYKNWPKFLALFEAAKDAAALADSMKFHVASIREETNDTIHEGNVKHSCTNLRNAIEYWEEVNKALAALGSCKG